MAYKLFGGKKPQMNNASSMKTNAAMYASKTSMYGKKPMMDGGPGDKIPPPPKEKGYEYAVWNKKYGDAYRKQEKAKDLARTQKMINERKAAATAKENKEAPYGRTKSGQAAGKGEFFNPKTKAWEKTIFDDEGDFLAASSKAGGDISRATGYKWRQSK